MKLNKISIILTLILAQSLFGATYYVDAVNGNDTNLGTSGAPWQTVAKVQAVVAAGDTVKFRTGSYGSFVLSNTSPKGTSWTSPITYIADTGQTPSFTRFSIDGRGSILNAYIIIDGLKFENGGTTYSSVVYISDTSHFKIQNSSIDGGILQYYAGAIIECAITLTSYGTSSPDYTDITISGCYISGTQKGIDILGFSNNDIVISNNTLHDLVRTAISYNPYVSRESNRDRQMVIENNKIYNQWPKVNTVLLRGVRTGTFIRGETVTQATTGAFGTFSANADNSTEIKVTPQSTVRFQAGYNVTGATSHATETDITSAEDVAWVHGSGMAIRGRNLIVKNNIIHSYGGTRPIYCYQAVYDGAVTMTGTYSNANRFVESEAVTQDATGFTGNYMGADSDTQIRIYRSSVNNVFVINQPIRNISGTVIFTPTVIKEARPSGGYSNMLFENNLIYDSKNVGCMQIYDAGINCVVRNNTFISQHRLAVDSDYYSSGLNVSYAPNVLSGVTIANNVIVGALDIDSQGTMTILNNIAYSYVYGGNANYQYLSGNIIVTKRTQNLTYFTGSGNFFVGGADFDNYAFKFDNVNGLPMFVDLGNSFAITATSPARGYANPTYAPSTDILGRARGSQPDAGCYEYISGASDPPPVNHAPVLTAIGNKSVNAGSTLTFDVNATDADNDSLTYSSGTLPSGASFNAGTKTFTWTPAVGQAGTYQVAFTVSDGKDTDSETITITVHSVNSAPVLAAIGNKTVNEGVQLSFTVTASDADGDTLTYSAANLPSGATFANRVFTWTPNYNQSGSSSVTITVSDGALSDSETITITVNNTNRPPVLTAIGNKTVAEGTALSFSIIASDPEGSPITYQASNLPSGATFTGQSFSWTPNYSQAGTYSVTFSANDGSASDTEMVTITVTNTNRAPALNAIGNKSVNEGQSLSFTISGTDADSQTLTYSAQNLPAGASFANRVFSWIPTFLQAGSYSVTFSVTDGTLTDSETITITVANVTAPPVLDAIGNKTVAEGETLSFSITATDPEGLGITYQAANLPSGALFAGQSFTWTPIYNQAGTYSVTFTASDGSASDSETITITVTGVNMAPVVADIPEKTAYKSTEFSLTIDANDPDGDALTYSASGLPAGASFAPAAKTFTWTPVVSQVGTSYSVTFAVSDGKLSRSKVAVIKVEDNKVMGNIAKFLNQDNWVGTKKPVLVKK